MTFHKLMVQLDDVEAAKLAAGFHVFPEHPDSRQFLIHCPDRERCNGWMECHRQHLCQHGHPIEHDALSIEGPCPGMEDENCIPYYEEEAEFHGEWHTHRWGYGWTVKYPGCVTGDADWDINLDRDTLPIGEYGVDEDWDDFSCYLTVTNGPVRRHR